MSQKNEIPILVLSILITGGLVAGGFWWFSRKSGLDLNKINTGNTKTLAFSWARTDRKGWICQN